VGGERDVVELDRRGQPPVPGGILAADQGGVEEGEVGDEVGREAYNQISVRIEEKAAQGSHQGS